MRVAHLIWSLDIGGSESMLVDVANRQAESCDVAVVVGNAVVDERVLAGLSTDVSVMRCGRRPGSRNPIRIYGMWRKLHRYRPDIIHAHNPSLIAAIPFVRSKRVLTVHDTEMQFSRSVRRFDLVASISRAVQTDLARNSLRIPSTLVYNGIDFGAIIPRRWYSVPKPMKIVQVSRLLVEKKGQDILLDAVGIITERLGPGQVSVDFIGDGPDRELIERRAAKMGVADMCRFLGPMSRGEVYRVLPTYDLLVQPSRYEGFGLTVVEGVAAGIPVLASDLEGPREILGYVAGRYLFSPNDPEDCARQILQIIDECSKPDFHQRLITNRQALLERFDVSVTASSYLREYQRLLRNG